MSKDVINNTLPILNYWVKRLGWLVLTGVALICAAIVFYVAFLRPAEQRLHALERDVTQVGSVQHRSVWRPNSPRVAQLNFYHTLSPEKSVPDFLEKIFDAAYENELILDQGQFKRVQAPEGVTFSQYQMVLPVTGSYAEIRKFVNKVLQEIPSAALDDINFSREDVKTPEVEAKTRFTVYLKVGE